ncbi:MAG TPA: helix-hairpin-helix domain-containing protein [Pirellulales bacterium]|jgi:competence protein ComEA|nr:helix-hairpin-helix domain-containing protein [Pirellulales bacterium]
MPDDQPSKPAISPWLLRRADQAVVAGFCLFALLALAIYFIAQGGLRGRLIEIDHADHVTAGFKVDVNTADWPELITIPEIGQTLAQRIVEYRRQHGPFQAVDDLRHVRGIGPKTLERLKAYVLPISAPSVVQK